MEAKDILKIGEFEAEKLFPGNAKAVKTRFRELAHKWHPDISVEPLATKVFAHINRLHDVITGKSAPSKASPSAKASTRKIWKLEDGKSIAVKTVAVHRGALGDVNVTSKTVAYEIITGFEDVADAEVKMVKELRFADSNMEKSLCHFLPKFERQIDAIGFKVNVFERPSDTILLTDLVRQMGGRIPPVHVAWIVSSLENIACYLNWLGVCHGAIAAENILVSPSKHSIILVGGWGYATAFGKRPSALPERTLSLIPRLTVAGEKVGPNVDLALIRSLAIELLGTSGSGGLTFVTDLPEEFRMWLTLPAKEDAFSDYSAWETSRDAAFGPRKFINLDIKPTDVYASA